ncbi:MAG: phosphoribosylglycinamide formyltransferase, partial [Candidatus Bathyarchaeia archaeon]
MPKVRIGVLASGKGSDFQAIVDHVKLDVLQNLSVELLICNVRDAPVCDKAQSLGVPTETIDGVTGKRNFANPHEKDRIRQEFDKQAEDSLKDHGVELVALAGFNQVLGKEFVERYDGKLMNVHPAYDLSRFGGWGMLGRKVHEAVLKEKEPFSGCTVHYVTSGVDAGPAILRKHVRVKIGDNSETLADRVLVWEHRLYPKAIQLHVDGRLIMQQGKVYADLFSDLWNLNW